MPTTRTRQKRKRYQKPKDGIIHFLETGGISSDIDAFLLFNDTKRQAEIWMEIRDKSLAAWIAERPGTRPWIWWRLEAPKEELDEYNLPKFGNQAAFLDRHNLLTAAEKKRLSPADYSRKKI